MATAPAEVPAAEGSLRGQKSVHHTSVFLRVVFVWHEQGNQTAMVVVMQHNGSVKGSVPRFRARFEPALPAGQNVLVNVGHVITVLRIETVGQDERSRETGKAATCL